MALRASGARRGRRRPRPRVARHATRPAVLQDDALHEGEPEPDASLPSREERLKDLFARSSVGNAGTVVANLEGRRSPSCAGRTRDLDDAARRKDLHGVHEQVQRHLIDRARGRSDASGSGSIGRRRIAMPRSRACASTKSAARKTICPSGARSTRELARPAELEQARDDALDAVDLVAQQVQKLARLLVGRCRASARGAVPSSGEHRAASAPRGRRRRRARRRRRTLPRRQGDARRGRRSAAMRLNAAASVPISSPRPHRRPSEPVARPRPTSSAAAVSSPSGRVTRRAAVSATASAASRVPASTAPRTSCHSTHRSERFGERLRDDDRPARQVGR